LYALIIALLFFKVKWFGMNYKIMGVAKLLSEKFFLKTWKLLSKYFW